MASLIPGYEYDIFISYRQKDNKGDRWVSEFVEALKDELESTFKDEVSVYFDINPHDGLLETHDVDASIESKLKCLVFIPIISRTYCDPRSFGWEHEFKAFVEQVSMDQFGLKVKLPGGNVASRVLPIRIHDLDSNDIALCESLTGGVLRGVEFIYKTPGVNRPLRPKEDRPQDNLNNTIYRDQINKVALAIKDIILGLKSGPAVQVKEIYHDKELPLEVRQEKRQPDEKKRAVINKPKLLTVLVPIAILIIAALSVFPKIFKNNKTSDLRSSDGRISVAVMPFQNMTNDTKLSSWQKGIQDELINNLTNTDELKVEPSEKINGLLQSQGITNYALVTSSVADKISEKLNANVFINGSINQSGSTLRVNAQLTNSHSGEVLRSFKKEGSSKDEIMFTIIDPLANEIKNFLIISGLKEEVYIDPQRTGSSDNPEAYRYFAYGQKAFAKRDFPEAINMLKQAVDIDSNLTYAILHIGWAYLNQGVYDEAKKWCMKAYVKRDQMPLPQKTYTDFVHARFFGTPLEAIKYLKQLQEIDDQWPHLHFDMGSAYSVLLQYDRAIPEYEKALEMYRKSGLTPWWALNYAGLGKAYHETRQFKKERKLYKTAEQDFPDDPAIIQRQAVLALTTGDKNLAEKYINKYKSIQKDNGVSEADIAVTLASVYSQANISDVALEYYRMALSLEPGNPERMNSLAYFIIDNNRNSDEGLELVEKALKLMPDDYSYLHTKGWGLYKQGKYKEALEILQKSWDLRIQNAIYNHTALLHLEAAKKAVAGQK